MEMKLEGHTERQNARGVDCLSLSRRSCERLKILYVGLHATGGRIGQFTASPRISDRCTAGGSWTSQAGPSFAGGFRFAAGVTRPRSPETRWASPSRWRAGVATKASAARSGAESTGTSASI